MSIRLIAGLVFYSSCIEGVSSPCLFVSQSAWHEFGVVSSKKFFLIAVFFFFLLFFTTGRRFVVKRRLNSPVVLSN